MDGMIAHWAEALRCADKSGRAAAARQLAECERPLAPAMVALVIAAGDRDDETRLWAADALEVAGPPSLADVSRLAAILTLPASRIDGECAYWAAKVLGRLGPAAAGATLALATALESSPYLAVREQAAGALGRIGPAAADQATAALLEASIGRSPRLARLALSALESLRGMAA